MQNSTTMVKVQIMSKNGHDEDDMSLSLVRDVFSNKLVTCQMKGGQQVILQQDTQVNEDDIMNILISPCLMGG